MRQVYIQSLKRRVLSVELLPGVCNYKFREFRVRRSRHYVGLIQAAWKLSGRRHVLSTIF